MNPRKRGTEKGEPIWGNPEKGDLDPCRFAQGQSALAVLPSTGYAKSLIFSVRTAGQNRSATMLPVKMHTSNALNRAALPT